MGFDPYSSAGCALWAAPSVLLLVGKNLAIPHHKHTHAHPTHIIIIIIIRLAPSSPQLHTTLSSPAPSPTKTQRVAKSSQTKDSIPRPNKTVATNKKPTAASTAVRAAVAALGMKRRAAPNKAAAGASEPTPPSPPSSSSSAAAAASSPSPATGTHSHAASAQDDSPQASSARTHQSSGDEGASVGAAPASPTTPGSSSTLTSDDLSNDKTSGGGADVHDTPSSVLSLVGGSSNTSIEVAAAPSSAVTGSDIAPQHQAADPKAVCTSTPCVSRQLQLPAPSAQTLTCRQLDAIYMAFLRSHKAVFDNGTLLGQGGEGEVRLVEMEGAVYAAKRAENGCLVEFVYKKELEHTPWVQMPLGVVKDRDDDHTYSLYALAAGDLEHAWHGRQRLAAAAASAEQTDGPAEAASPAAASPAAAVQPIWSPAEFRALAAEALVGLGELHAVGVRHADVKPGNFVITRDNHLCVCDLGMADDADCHAMEQGTPFFMAPEQCASKWEWLQEIRERWAEMAKHFGLQRDHRKVDIWQLAVSWLVMMCPVGQEQQLCNLARQLGSQRWWRWQRRVQLPAWVPPEMSDLLLECMLVRDARQRWTIEQLQQHPFFTGVDWQAVESRQVPLPVDMLALACAGRQHQLQMQQQKMQQQEKGASSALDQ